MEACHLVDEERVATGRSVHSADELRGLRGAGRGLDQAGHLALREAVQREAHGKARDVRQGPRHVGRSAGLGVAVGRDEQDGSVAQQARRETEHPERCRVRRVNVVEEHGQRPLTGRVPEELDDVGEQLESGAFVVGDRSRCRHAGSERRLRRLGLRERIRLARETRDRLHHLCPRPKRGRAPALPATAPHNGEAPENRARRQLLEEPGLPDPRLSHHEVEPPPARRRGPNAAVELAKLAPSSDERQRLRQMGAEVAPERLFGDQVLRRYAPVRPCARRHGGLDRRALRMLAHRAGAPHAVNAAAHPMGLQPFDAQEAAHREHLA